MLKIQRSFTNIIVLNTLIKTLFYYENINIGKVISLIIRHIYKKKISALAQPTDPAENLLDPKEFIPILAHFSSISTVFGTVHILP